MRTADVKALIEQSGAIAISIYAPTHKTSPANQSDRILVKNLVDQAKAELSSHADKQLAEKALANLDKAFDSVDWNHNQEGLALLVSDTKHQTIRLNYSPSARVVVGSKFAIAELSKSAAMVADYHLLVLSESPTRLFRGERSELTEITGDFPIEHTGRGGTEGLPTDYGQQTSVIEDEEHRKFFRRVSDALGKMQAEEKLPLVVTGVERFLAFWMEVAKGQGPDLTIEGSYDFMTASELSNKTWKEISEHFAGQAKAAIAKLDDARSAKTYVGGFDEVLEMAKLGRVSLLVVSDEVLGRGDTDEAVASTIESGGEVSFVPGNLLAGFSEIAAKLRY